MKRDLIRECPDEFYVNINCIRLRFGLNEFVMVTGLQCGGEVGGENYVGKHIMYFNMSSRYTHG